MKVEVYYQQFEKNAEATFDDSKLVFEPESAHFMLEVDVKLDKKEPTNSAEDKVQVANYCMWLLNCSTRAKNTVQEDAKIIGHTSMSIGDYVLFPDGEVLLCKSTGWKTIKDVHKKQKK